MELTAEQHVVPAVHRAAAPPAVEVQATGSFGISQKPASNGESTELSSGPSAGESIGASVGGVVDVSPCTYASLVVGASTAPASVCSMGGPQPSSVHGTALSTHVPFAHVETASQGTFLQSRSSEISIVRLV